MAPVLSSATSDPRPQIHDSPYVYSLLYNCACTKPSLTPAARCTAPVPSVASRYRYALPTACGVSSTSDRKVSSNQRCAPWPRTQGHQMKERRYCFTDPAPLTPLARNMHVAIHGMTQRQAHTLVSCPPSSLVGCHPGQTQAAPPALPGCRVLRRNCARTI